MRVKNAAFLRPHSLTNFLLHLQYFVASLDQRSFQAIDFFWQLRLREAVFRNVRTSSSQHKDFAPAHSSGNRNAPKRLFAPRCWRWHRRLLAIASAVEKQFLAEKGWLQANLACLPG